MGNSGLLAMIDVAFEGELWNAWCCGLWPCIVGDSGLLAMIVECHRAALLENGSFAGTSVCLVTVDLGECDDGIGMLPSVWDVSRVGSCGVIASGPSDSW